MIPRIAPKGDGRHRQLGHHRRLDDVGPVSRPGQAGPRDDLPGLGWRMDRHCPRLPKQRSDRDPKSRGGRPGAPVRRVESSHHNRRPALSQGPGSRHPRRFIPALGRDLGTGSGRTRLEPVPKSRSKPPRATDLASWGRVTSSERRHPICYFTRLLVLLELPIG